MSLAMKWAATSDWPTKMEETWRPKTLRTANGRSESGVTWQAPPLNACITTFSPRECMLISVSTSTPAPCRPGVCAEAVSPTSITKAVKVFIRPPRCQNGSISHFRQITSVIFLPPLCPSLHHHRGIRVTGLHLTPECLYLPLYPSHGPSQNGSVHQARAYAFQGPRHP